MKYLAFHNDAALQAAVLAEVDAHVAADRVIQRTYGSKKGACFIGCLAGDNNPRRVWERTGFPEMLTRIAENIFEGLPAKECPAFFSDVLHAPRLGADLSLVAWQFLHMEVRDALEQYGTPEVRSGCAKALDVLERKALGKRVSKGEACAADYAALAAYAATPAADAANAACAAAVADAAACAAADADAYAAAYAAYAADADAYAAARAAANAANAAYAADAAACAANAAYVAARPAANPADADAARAAARQKQAERLIGLLKAAPIPSETKKEG